MNSTLLGEDDKILVTGKGIFITGKGIISLWGGNHMGMMTRPEVITLADGGTCFENTFEKFFVKAYYPANSIRSAVNNYTFRQPLLLVFEEERLTMAGAIDFAQKTGLEKIAKAVDASVYFIYPTCEGGWKNADESLYAAVIAEVKMHPEFKDNIVELNDFFTRTFKGYFLRGAIFRADIYSYGASADYVATHLLKKLDGEYLWGPGEITPAMCSMERLRVVPKPERTDIGILSVGNSDEINKGFAGCKNLLIKQTAEYEKDFKGFVRRFKMWCGTMEEEPDFPALGMTEEPGSTVVKTSPDNRFCQGSETHEVGYFAYYNNGIFDKGPVPLLVGLHGGGDTSMFFTFVSGWWQVCHDHDFLYVSLDDHLRVTATEIIEIIEDLKKKYNIDEHRIYAAGFSMGSGKTWDLFQEYPQVFAGLAPGSALFPMKNNNFGKSITDGINMDVPVALFYSGGEKSPLPELPFQAEQCGDRIEYLAKVNNWKNFSEFPKDRASWGDPEYGYKPDRIEKLHDEVRDSILTVRYYDSADGICRTALASINNQQHEYRHHTAETAWKFISQFSRE